MFEFNYVAVDANGARQRGRLSSETAREARQQLRAQGLTPVQLHPVAEGVGNGATGRSVRMSIADQALFCRLVGTLLESGLDLSHALESAGKQSHGRNRQFYDELLAGISRGEDLSAVLDALLGAECIVPVAAVAAGERTGSVAHVLLTSADHADSQAALRAKVQAALLYPVILTAVSVLVAIGLVGIVFSLGLAVVAEVGNSPRPVEPLATTGSDVVLTHADATPRPTPDPVDRPRNSSGRIEREAPASADDTRFAAWSYDLGEAGRVVGTIDADMLDDVKALADSIHLNSPRDALALIRRWRGELAEYREI